MSQSYCTQCGERLPETGNFCPACGAARETQPVSQPVSQQQPMNVDPSEGAPHSATAAPARRSPLLAASAIGALLLIAAALYLIFLRPQTGIANVPGCVVGQPCADETPADVQNAQGIPYPEVARIAPADAKARFDRESALFIDVRDEDSFAAAHIPGSILMPLNEIEALGTQLPLDKEIILYCT